ncbi:hypothetical protein ABZ686_22925 [Streptomyces sp. NPDC006992]|uniref:hypothetical protein n=1 Tax=unclassified Streptomyces TaxID=2593676 RepID=UPI0033DC90D6
MSEFAQGPGPGRVPEQHPGSATERYDETVRPDQPHGHPGQAPAGPEDPGVRRGPGLSEPEGARESEAAPGGDEEPGAEPEEEPEDGPRPLGVGVRPTGNGPVDARLKRLEDADHLAVSGHLEVYEDVHDGLRESLAALDRPHTPRS